ncbi:MAG: hypothetical protein IT486_07080 [Gammaproteobacteria bacterium]|nr:hypothetical protein [Gammaproteobacteria bacterium]
MSRYLRDGTISLVDQAILSLANFLVGVFLIQNTTKNEYGSYVLAYAAILLVIGAQNAIVTTQMTVRIPQKRPPERAPFCGALAVGQFLVFLPVLAMVSGLVATAATVGLISGRSAVITAVIGMACFGILLREFARGYFFTQLRPMVVLTIDLAYVALLFVGLVLARTLAQEQLYLLAIGMLGLASLGSGWLALASAQLPWRQSLTNQVKVLRESWIHGRWALGGVGVTWLQDQSYVYLLSLLAGTASTAEANAARLLLMPVMLLNTGISRITMPMWSNLRHEGRRHEIEMGARRIFLTLSLAIVGYVAVMVAIEDLIVPFLFSSEYTSMRNLVVLWGAVLALQIARSNYSVILQVHEGFRQITQANTVSALVAVVAALVLIPSYGIEGSLLALLGAEATLTLLLATEWRRRVRAGT